MRVAPARETAHSPPQSSSFSPALSNQGASIAPAGPLCIGAETAGSAAGAVQPPEVKFAGAGRCSRPLGGPGAEEGASRAGSLPSSGRWRGWAPAWLPPWSSSRRRPAGLVTSRVKALVTRTGLCCASSGKRKSGKRLERSIGCVGVNGGALVGGDGRIMKVEWKEAA